MNKGPGASAPHVMRTSLAAPYVYGTLFVHALRRLGGWEAGNRTWDDPPTTSEQLLHLEKWQIHEPAAKVTAPSCAVLGAGWRVSDEDSEGELGVRIAFEEWMGTAIAAEASAGWGGDRGVLVENGSRAAFAWHLRYESGSKSAEDRATRAFKLVATALERELGVVKSRDADVVCHERADRGPIALKHDGRDLVFVLGPAATGAAKWTSAGNCALSRKWIGEILAR